MDIWEELHDSHKGEVALIVGNGPSLNEIPVDFLAQYPSFGSNGILLHEEFVPTYYVAVNLLVCEQFAPMINECKSKLKFIEKGRAHLIPDCIPLQRNGNPFFSTEPGRLGVYNGYTVTFVSLQLAYWMGFSAVLLVGCDHRYEQDGKPNTEQFMDYDDPNHFTPDYFKGKRWNLADIPKMEHSYHLAKMAYNFAGRGIFNITPGSALNIFPKMDWRFWYGR